MNLSSLGLWVCVYLHDKEAFGISTNKNRHIKTFSFWMSTKIVLQWTSEGRENLGTTPRLVVYFACRNSGKLALRWEQGHLDNQMWKYVRGCKKIEEIERYNNANRYQEVWYYHCKSLWGKRVGEKIFYESHENFQRETRGLDRERWLCESIPTNPH